MTDTRMRPHPRFYNLVPPLVRDGLRAVQDAAEPELWIYDYIDAYGDPEWGGVSARMVIDALGAIGPVPALSVRISSPGGDYFEAVTIYNALVRNGANVTVHVDGLAASAASVITMAGNRVIMGQGAQIMIHEARTFECGTADMFRATAVMLDQTNDDIAGFYAAKAGGDAATWRAAVAEETWYTAQAAVSAGLADEVASPPARSAPTNSVPPPVVAPPAPVENAAPGREPIIAPASSTDEQSIDQPRADTITPTPVASSPAPVAPPVDTPVPPALPPTNLAELIRSSVRKAIPA